MGGNRGGCGWVRKTSSPTGVRNQDRPARSEWLYLPRYPGSSITYLIEYRLCTHKNILYYISYITHLNATSGTHILLVYSRPGLGKYGRSYTKNELTEKGREYIVSAWSTRVVYSHVALNYTYAFLFTFVVIHCVLCRLMGLLISQLFWN